MEDAQKALRDMSTGYIKDCRVRTTVALPRYGGSAGRAKYLNFYDLSNVFSLNILEK